MDIINILNTRYACKKYQPNRQLTESQENVIYEVLQKSPSSVNSQPWHFLSIKNQQEKERIAVAFSDDNKPKIKDCSMVIIMCSKNIDEEHLSRVTEQEFKDGRYKTPEDRTSRDNMRKQTVFGSQKNVAMWADRQVYINLGFLLFSSQMLGLNSTPIEAFSNEKLDALLELDKKGLKSLTAVALGFAADDDFNKSLPKSRLPITDILTKI